MVKFNGEMDVDMGFHVGEFEFPNQFTLINEVSTWFSFSFLLIYCHSYAVPSEEVGSPKTPPCEEGGVRVLTFLLLKALIYELVFYFEYTFFFFPFFKGDVMKFATL